MFGKKSQLEEAEATIRQLTEQVDKYKRMYEKQQGYIEGLYDLIGDLTRQLGYILRKENLERLQSHPFLEENSDFLMDLHLLFSSKVKKGSNVTCYFGKDLPEIKRKFQDRDFKNSALIHQTERFTIEDLRSAFREHMWKRPLAEGLSAIRNEKGLEQIS